MNEVTDYVAQVRTALADLPPSARDELLEDLPEHLAEVAAEGEGSLAERLGPPAAYAAELRAAAGAPTAHGRRLAMDLRLRAAVGRVRARLQVVDTKAGPVIGYQKGSDFLRLLRPAWWVARGYLVAMALAYMLSNEPIGLLPRVDVGDSTVASVVVLLAFVVGSIWLGDRARRLSRAPRYALGLGTSLLVVIAVAALFDADDYAQRNPFGEAPTGYYDNVHSVYVVDSVYVYDQQGRPLRDVLVFDQNGQPIRLAWPEAIPQPETNGNPTPVPTPTPAATPTPSATG